jgi:arylsulfatase A
MENSRISRRDFLKAVGTGAGTLFFPGCVNFSQQPESAICQDKLNFLIVLCDDLGYGDLACYGHPHIKTPNLDRFAKEGMKLTDCYAAAPVCSPARAGMLTGRTPHRCGIYDWIPHSASRNRTCRTYDFSEKRWIAHSWKQMHLRQQEATVAELLKQAGYATCHVGKWHCNSYFNSPQQPQPDAHGFDYWFSTQNNAYPSHENPVNFVRNGKKAGKIEGYSSEIIVDEAMNWLDNHWNKVKPFCIFVWFHSPHEPVDTEKKFMDMYPGKKEAIYYGNVTQMDHAFGRLMDRLDDMKLRDNTFVMFTSDNGPETLDRYRGAERSYGSPGPLRGMKLHVYEGGIRVPGIIRWPGWVKCGSVCSEPVNSTDILPTLCSMADVEVPTERPIDGASILPIFQGKSVVRNVPLYWRYDDALSRPFTVAMRDGDWKILANNEMTKFELYNVRMDIGEAHNLASRHPNLLKKMKETLIKLHTEIDAEGPIWK